MKQKYYPMLLTKSELNKLYELVKNNKKEIPNTLCHKLSDLYIMANDIIVNGGGA